MSAIVRQLCLAQSKLQKPPILPIREFCFGIKNHTMSSEKESDDGLPLNDVISELKNFADLSLAESWDNVGLLIEPFTKTHVKRILLTNDLTELVMQESIEKKINLIISYHPPIFNPLKRITNASWKERLVAACLENRIAVFSPHTSWDAVYGGVNDWLADSFANHIVPGGKIPITQTPAVNSEYIVTIIGPSSSVDRVLMNHEVVLISKHNEDHSLDVCTIICSEDVMNKLRTIHSFKIGSIKCEKNDKQICGMGRMLHVEGLTISKCVELVKNQIGLPFLRLALAKNKCKDSEVHSIAVCAGSGGSLLKGVKADLYVTGEMFHHDVLDANHNATSIILTNHSDSERGFLTKIQKSLQIGFKNSVNIAISDFDSDPLKTV